MRVYFVGICGTAMGNVAVLMQQMGHQVGGSDSGIYPPMSHVLKDSGVEMFPGWDEANLERFNPELVVVGNAVTRGNPEVECLLRSKRYPFVSLPELIGEQLLQKRQRIVISGTHGKTTTTAMAAWLLKETGSQPGWLIGGVPRSLPSGSELGDTRSPFVLEGDEYDSAFFDKRSKFILYRPDVLVINNIEFDHADIFRDLTDVRRTFNHLIRIVPDNGVILANGDDPVVGELFPVSWTRVCFVGTGEKSDYRIREFIESPQGSRFRLEGPGGEWEFGTSLRGLYNARNAAMALLAAGFADARRDPVHFLNRASFDGFAGVARRQDVLFQSDRLKVIEDFAHHPTAIRLCIESFRNCFPDSELVAVFEPRSNTSATNVLQAEFTEALSHADTVYISPVYRAEIYSDSMRMDPAGMVSALLDEQCRAIAFGSKEALFESLSAQSSVGNRLVLLFTNGSFGEPLHQYLKRLESR